MFASTWPTSPTRRALTADRALIVEAIEESLRYNTSAPVPASADRRHPDARADHEDG